MADAVAAAPDDKADAPLPPDGLIIVPVRGMVLFPGEFRISRSLRRRLRHADYRIRLDGDFPAVMHACAETSRKGQNGTWIGGAMQDAYRALFELGVAPSVET